MSSALRSIIVPLTEDLAILSATRSTNHKLAMAEAILYATAQSRKAELVPGDDRFRSLAGVIFIPGRTLGLHGR